MRASGILSCSICGLFVLCMGLSPAGAQPNRSDDPASAQQMAPESGRAGTAEAAYEAGDLVTAKSRFRALAEQGSVAGMTHLAAMYAAGEGGRRSDEQALYWYTKAARKGDADAMYQVADAYRRGWGTPTCPDEADRWYREAAEHDNAQAQWLLGRRLYKRGQRRAGLEWIRTAARAGDVPQAERFLAERNNSQ